jgi:hypothetical protein
MSKFSIEAISKKNSADRKRILQKFFSEVLMPQRLGLLRSRELTWQSAFVDSDGYIAEMISSIILGVPGVSRRGVTRSSGDLADETEVKKGFRADPNIDFLIKGRLSSDGVAIEVDRVPQEFLLADIQNQLNANASSVQLIEKVGLRRIGRDLFVTRSRNCLQLEVRGGSGKIILKEAVHPGAVTRGKLVEFCIRQERGHINFGNKSRSQLREILQSRPVMVFYGHHLTGGLQIVVVRAGMEGKLIDAYLDRIYGRSRPAAKRQVQPYLYPDNIRDSLYTSDVHSVATALSARLLMVANERKSGLVIDYWDPAGGQTVVKKKAEILRRVSDSEAPDIAPQLAFKSAHEKLSAKSSSWFFDQYVAAFYRKMESYCQLTSTTRNIGFGNLSQHLVSHVVGIHGTRSGARGADLIEQDGTPSEVKVATGERDGDAMGTEDMPRLTLGWGEDKMLGWKRLFAVRIVDQGKALRILVHGPSPRTMTEFRKQVRSYFHGRTNNGSGGLQYHASQAFPHDTYGPRERQLSFDRLAEFWEGKAAKFRSGVARR